MSSASMQDMRSMFLKKTITFLYRSNKSSHSEIKRTLPFIIASKGRKYFKRRLIDKQKMCVTSTLKSTKLC